MKKYFHPSLIPDFLSEACTHFTGLSFLIILTAIGTTATLHSCRTPTEKLQLDQQLLYPKKIILLDKSRAAELAQKIRKEVAVELADGLELSLWASDTLVADPIAISIDAQGRVFYTSATRQANSEFDIRGHRNWMTASISFQSVEDRRKFLRETFSKDSEESKKFLKDLNKDGVRDWRDLAVEKEQVWHLEDTDKDGIADKAQLYLEDFHEEVTDVANGVEIVGNDVFVSAGPDMWRTQDKDKDGIADHKESISHGYAVHIGFSGHGMSGATVGPDGRIWWGIGDIGMNVVDKTGKQWKYPNEGVIVRSEPDGSDFEVYASGLRNTHEFVFDQYGNLISEDNDGDHEGERERLVYLIDGSDTGWRTNWQFGKYTDPDNNRYKVWMDEKMSIPRWDGQAAYILPTIANYVNGPTGMVYNPGTALGEKWYNHFFIAEFRGSPANSPIHAFTLKPKGASFELDKTEEVVKGLLPTGMDFGPDGALYFADWIDGWGTKDQGRIWKLDVPGEANSAIRQETKKLIQEDFSPKTEAVLSKLLQHQDMRIRQKAQFELVKREAKGLKIFIEAAKQKKHQLARVHALWGLGQLARKNPDHASYLMPFLKDNDPEITAQAAKVLGDIRYAKATQDLIPLLKNKSLRVQLLATEALGRIGQASAFQAITQMLIANNDEDAWLRHAGAIALSRLNQEKQLIALSKHNSKALRMAAVVALRRMQSPGVAKFLEDKDELIVTEAARAINDDYSIEPALPDLARVLKEPRFSQEALLRRVINANLRVGQPENIRMLTEFVTQGDASVAMRAEALEALSTWAKPSVFDRVDGRYRGEINRDAAPVKKALQPLVVDLLKENNSAIQIAAAKVVAKFQIPNTAEILTNMLNSHPEAEVRTAALKAIYGLKDKSLDSALEKALQDKESLVRSTALEILPESGLAEDKTVQLFEQVLKVGSVEEKQTVLTALSKLTGAEAKQALSKALDELVAGKLAPEVQLDLIEAIETQNSPDLMKELKAFQDAKPKDDPLALYKETLAGGKRWEGQRVFYENEAAQCVRCHAIFEYGGNAGPGLAGVGSRLTPEKILESLVAPSAAYALGYEVVSLKLKNQESISGVVTKESPTQLSLRIGKEDIKVIDKSQIAERKSVPSAMPPMGRVLSKRQIRDLIAFLRELKEEEQ